MAAKMNVMKLLQEIRSFTEFTSRRSSPKLPSASKFEWAWHGSRQFPRLPRRQIVPISILDPIDIPEPVTITYIKAAAPTLVAGE
jgi:hypothetical protein